MNKIVKWDIMTENERRRSKKGKEKRKKIGKEKDKLECAVDGAPSQSLTLKFLTHPAPRCPPLGHDPSNSVKILFNMFSIFYL